MMTQDKMHLINKIFNNETIRIVWDKEKKYYISVVDIVRAITESADGRKYWNKLKQRLREEGNEMVTNCHQLKLKVSDGKYRLTDVVDIEGMQDRKKLTDIWKDGGITENKEYAILTNEIYKEWSGMTSREYKQYKGLRKESLRDNMSDIEITLADLREIATREIAKKHRPYGLDENKEIAKMGGHAAKVARVDIEKIWVNLLLLIKID